MSVWNSRRCEFSHVNTPLGDALERCWKISKFIERHLGVNALITAGRSRFYLWFELNMALQNKIGLATLRRFSTILETGQGYLPNNKLLSKLFCEKNRDPEKNYFNWAKRFRQKTENQGIRNKCWRILKDLIEDSPLKGSTITFPFSLSPGHKPQDHLYNLLKIACHLLSLNISPFQYFYAENGVLNHCESIISTQCNKTSIISRKKLLRSFHWSC